MRTGTIIIALFIGLGAGLGKLAYRTHHAESQTERAVLDTVDRVYDAVSGGPGEARDWDQFRAAFVDDRARITAFVGFGAGANDGDVPAHRCMTPDEFIAIAQANAASSGFFERPISTRTEVYGRLAHVWSTYEARREPQGPAFMHGINSFTLIRGPDDRWRVLNLAWEDERAAGLIPDRYRGS